jgi:protein-glutamine gamma-glutamyltransferase
MIYVSGGRVSMNVSGLTDVERTVFQDKDRSRTSYHYSSLNELRFELKLRDRIVQAAKDLNASGIGFATFRNSRCNEQYWTLTAEGGFRLKEGVLPSEGIRDIFENGRLYACECATAKVIVLYKGVLDTLQEQTYNVLFSDLLLWDWNYDRDLRLMTYQSNFESYQGDVIYFDNPDVSPQTPWWQGENAVVLEKDLFYGHGIGITNAAGIIAVLNRNRKPGSTQSAILLDQVTHPDFKYLSQFSSTRPVIVGRIGSSRFVKE